MGGLKMTKIIILAFMITSNPLEKDSYVFTEPYFDSESECKMYLNVNIQHIIKHLFEHFDGKKVENIYCIPEKLLNQFIENRKI